MSDPLAHVSIIVYDGTASGIETFVMGPGDPEPEHPPQMRRPVRPSESGADIAPP